MDNHVLKKENEKKKIDVFKSKVYKLEKLAEDVQTSVSNEEISKRVDELKRELSLMSMSSKSKDELRKNLNILPKKQKLLKFAKKTLNQNGYELLKPIGKGAFGQVYHARVIKDIQESLKVGDDVAIKLIDLEIVDLKDMHSYVQSEIQIHSILDHPFVLKLYDHFEDEYSHYLVLAYCPNGDLRKLLSKKVKLLEEQACQMFVQVLQGIVYLHENNIVHRDLKPGNLLLDEHNNIKIADFGLAKQLDDDTDRYNTRCGTPGYMAPEVGDRPYRKEVDIYSLGCLLYNLVIGCAPDKCDSEDDLKEKICHLSTDLQDLLLSMLRENPRKRIKLDRILDHEFLKRNSNVLSKFTSFSKDSGVGSSRKTSHSQPSNEENPKPFEAVIRQRPSRPLKDLNNVDINSSEIYTRPRFGKAPLARPERRNRPMDALKAKFRVRPLHKADFNDYECDNDNLRIDNVENVNHPEECIGHQNTDLCNPHLHITQNCDNYNRNHDDVHCERRCRSSSPHNSNGCCDSGLADRKCCSQCGNSLSACNRSNHPCIHNSNHRNSNQNNQHYLVSPCGGRSDVEYCSQQDSVCSHNGQCPVNNKCLHAKTCHCHQSYPRQQHQSYPRKQYPAHDPPDCINFIGRNGLPSSQVLYRQQSIDTISKMSTVTKKPEFFSVLHLGESEKCYQNKVFRASILSTREVCMEFFGKRKYHNKVTRTYLISSDGMHIKVYNFDHRGIQLSAQPPSLPENKNYKFQNENYKDYHYNDLPEKHWTAYLYASKYIKNCKGRTPGVIFYSSRAKAVLMLDFVTYEITFYNGTNIVKKFDSVEMTSSNGAKKIFDCNAGIGSLSTNEQEIWKHASELIKNCYRIPELVDRNEFPPCFPVICGRKPRHHRKTSRSINQENITWPSSISSTIMDQHQNVSVSSNYPLKSSNPFEKRIPLRSSQNATDERVSSSKHHNNRAQRLRRI